MIPTTLLLRMAFKSSGKVPQNEARLSDKKLIFQSRNRSSLMKNKGTLTKHLGQKMTLKGETGVEVVPLPKWGQDRICSRRRRDVYAGLLSSDTVRRLDNVFPWDLSHPGH